MRVLVILLALALAGALYGWRSAQRGYIEYRTANAPVVELAPAPCPLVGLVAHWRLDALEGGLFRDASGLDHHLRPSGSFAPLAQLRFGKLRVAPGRVGSSAVLGGHHWLVGPNVRCFVTDTLSVAAWVRLDDAVDVPTIVGKSSWPADGFWLLVTSAPPFAEARRLELGFASEEGVGHVDADYVLPLREWHHVAVTVDGPRGEVRFFVDGAAQGEPHRGVPRWRVNTTQPIVIGDDDDTGRWPWKGALDEIRVWNRVASAEEIRAAFEAGR